MCARPFPDHVHRALRGAVNPAPPLLRRGPDLDIAEAADSTDAADSLTVLNTAEDGKPDDVTEGSA